MRSGHMEVQLRNDLHEPVLRLEAADAICGPGVWGFGSE